MLSIKLEIFYISEIVFRPKHDYSTNIFQNEKLFVFKATLLKIFNLTEKESLLS